MKKIISISLFILMSSAILAQQTATDTTLKVLPMDRMKQETKILRENVCYQILMREENIRLKYKPTQSEKNTPAKRILKALQIQFYLENCSERDKNDFKTFNQIRY